MIRNRLAFVAGMIAIAVATSRADLLGFALLCLGGITLWLSIKDVP